MDWFQRTKGFSVLLSKGKRYPTTKFPVATLEEAVALFNSDTYKLTKKDNLNIVSQIQYDDLWVVERLGDGRVDINRWKIKEIWDKELDSL